MNVTLSIADGPVSALALGGFPGSSGPPGAIVVGRVVNSGTDYFRVLSDQNDGSTFNVSQQYGAGLPCDANISSPQAAVSNGFKPAPSGDVPGRVVFGSCTVILSGIGSTATGLSLTKGNNATIDPAWGTNAYVGSGSSSAVLIATQGDRGIQKSSNETASEPDWPSGPPFTDDAVAGVASTSDGIAVNGLSVPVVKDVVFGPNGATDVAVMFSTSGGGLCLASNDGLATAANVKPVVGRGGRSVAWWSGAGGQTWILCGHGDGTLSGLRDWTPASAAASGSIAVSGGSTFRIDPSGGGTNGRIDAIAPISGAATAFVGGKIGTSPSVTGKVLREALSLSGGGAVQFAAGAPAFALPEAVNRMKYCPAAGSATGFQDVLFIGTYDPKTGDGGNATNLGGKVYRLAGASTAADGATPVALTGSATTGVGGLDVNCADGVLYAGFRQENATGASLQRSTNGTSLADVTVASGPALSVRSLAMNPSSSREIILSSGADGFVYGSIDGGVTWILANNASQFPGGVNFQSEGIAALAIPPGLTRSAVGKIEVPRGGGFHNMVQKVYALAAVSSSSTVVGSGGGAYKTSLRSGLTGSSGGGSGGGGGSTGSSTPSRSTGSSSATTRIAAAKWSAAKRTVTANVTVQKAGKVTLTVSIKKGSKLTTVTTGSATIKKAGTAAAVFTLKKKLAKGTYVLTIAGGGTTTLVVR